MVGESYFKRCDAKAYLRVLLIAVSFAAWSSTAVAANQRFEVGDEVDVFFLNKWWSGRVLQIDPRGAVGAEYVFGASSQQRVFAQNEVRLKCEVDALGPAREWKDASGKFRIRAALVRYSGEQVTIRKVDMEEINVPVSALGTADQRYLAKIKKDAPSGTAGAGGLARIERFSGTPAGSSRGMPGSRGPADDDMPFGGGQSMSFGGGKEAPRGRSGRMTISFDEVDRRILTPDPMPSYLTFAQGGTGFPVEEFFAKVGAVVPVGGGDGWVLASVEDDTPSSEAKPTHLIWVSLTNQKLEKTQRLPVHDIVLDYHAPSHRLLTCSRANFERENEKLVLSVWEVLPTDKAAQSIVRWETNRDEIGAEAPWARFVNGNTVMQRVADKDYLAWDLAGKALRYRISQETFFDPTPAFSGTRKYFALPEDNRVRVFDSASGATVSTLPVKRGANAVAFSRDGQRLTVLEGSSMTIWNLTDAQAEPERLQAEAIGGGFDLTMAWVDDRHLMIDRGLPGMVLFSLEHQVALWSYQFGMDVERGADSSRSRALVADHLVYSASFSQGTQEGLAVGAVKLPGMDAQQAISALNPDSLMLIRRGSSIRVEVNAGKHNDRIRASLEGHAKNNGWKLDAGASNVLYAGIKQGEAEQVTYDFKGKRPNETVSATPYAHTVRIVCGDEKAWEWTANFGIPGLIAIGRNETVQDVVNRTPKVDPTFFDNVKIPERIFDPKKRRGLGASTVTNRGLVTK